MSNTHWTRFVRVFPVVVVFATAVTAQSQEVPEPTYNVAGPTHGCETGEQCAFTVEMAWPLAVAPASVWAEQPEPVSWAHVALGDLTVEDHGNERIYRQTVFIRSAAPGTYTLDGLQFQCTTSITSFPAESQESVTTDVSPALIPLRAPPIPLEVNSPSPSPWVFAGSLFTAAAALSALWAAWRFWSRRTVQAVPVPEGLAAGASPPQEPGSVDAFQEAMVYARRCRAEGDYYGFYRALTEAVAADAGLVERLRRKAEDVGFRHLTPTHDDMDTDLREVERVLARYRETDET